MKVLCVITIFILLQELVWASYYNCTFGPNNIIIVESQTANACGTDCNCTGLKNNTCQFGPNENGNFITQHFLSSELVDSCEQDDYCKCNEDIITITEQESEESIQEEDSE